MTQHTPVQPAGLLNALGEVLPPLCIMLYGERKRGKSMALLEAFPDGMFSGDAGNLQGVAAEFLNYTPNVLGHGEHTFASQPRTLWDVNDLLDRGVKEGWIGYWPIWCFDDAGHIIETTHGMIQDPLPGKEKAGAFATTMRLIHFTMEKARSLGVSTAWTLHEKGPHSTWAKEFRIGTAHLPSHNMGKQISGWADIFARVTINPDLPNPYADIEEGIKRGFFADPQSSEWIASSRVGVIKRDTVGNLREVLRATRLSYRCGRVPGLEWQDEAADAVCAAVDGGTDVREAALNVADYYISAGMHERHAIWAAQDGIARALFQVRSRLSLTAAARSGPVSKPGGAPPPPPPTA
tara:strand:+ start:46 stop:1098 length:1053 start_codon:yes stop_codon:yes gene_type:complete